METKTVKIGNDIYQLTAVTADISGAISIDLLTDVAPFITSLMDGNTELLNSEIRKSGDSAKIMRIMQELINFPLLEKNGDLIKDWKEEFARKPLTMFRLGYEALRFNCEDFFTSIFGFVKEKKVGENLQGIIKNLQKDGVEIPPVFSLLLQNGEVETETLNQNK